MQQPCTCAGSERGKEGKAHTLKSAKLDFVDWCPTGFKIIHCYHEPIAVPGSCIASVGHDITVLSNNTK